MRADKLKLGEPCIDALEDDWLEIEASIDLKEPDLSFRSRLAHYVKLALGPGGLPSFGEKDGPKLSKVKKQLRKLIKDAERLEDTLTELQKAAAEGNANADWTLYMTIHQWGKRLELDYPDLWCAVAPDDPASEPAGEYERILYERQSLSRLPHETQTLAISAVSHLAAASKAVMHSLPNSKGGAPKDIVLDELVCTLALFYKHETGKKPTAAWIDHRNHCSGEFFHFFYACCQAFAPSYADKKKQTLVKDVQRALKNMKTWCLKMDITYPF